MKFTDHIDVGDWKGQCLVTVWDYELHDFLEDFFLDHSIETLTVRPPGEPGKHQLLFPLAVSKATVHRLLAQVGSEEIDRIARINGGTLGTASGG